MDFNWRSIVADNRDTMRLEGDSSGLVRAIDRASDAWNQYNNTVNQTINMNQMVQNNFIRTSSTINNITVNMRNAQEQAKGLTVSLSGMARLVGVQLICQNHLMFEI